MKIQKEIRYVVIDGIKDVIDRPSDCYFLCSGSSDSDDPNYCLYPNNVQKICDIKKYNEFPDDCPLQTIQISEHKELNQLLNKAKPYLRHGHQCTKYNCGCGLSNSIKLCTSYIEFKILFDKYGDCLIGCGNDGIKCTCGFDEVSQLLYKLAELERARTTNECYTAKTQNE